MIKKEYKLLNQTINSFHDNFIYRYNKANMVNLLKGTLDYDEKYWKSFGDKLIDDPDYSYGKISIPNRKWNGRRYNSDIKFPIDNETIYIFSIEVKAVRLDKSIPKEDNEEVHLWFDLDVGDDEQVNAINGLPHYINRWDGIREDQWVRFYFKIDINEPPYNQELGDKLKKTRSISNLRVQPYKINDDNVKLYMRRPMMVKGEIFCDYYPNIEDFI